MKAHEGFVNINASSFLSVKFCVAPVVFRDSFFIIYSASEPLIRKRVSANGSTGRPNQLRGNRSLEVAAEQFNMQYHPSTMEEVRSSCPFQCSGRAQRTICSLALCTAFCTERTVLGRCFTSSVVDTRSQLLFLQQSLP